MSKWMLSPVFALVGALGLPIGEANAQTLNTRSFADEAQARTYLRNNPTGPLAKAAFLALVEFRLLSENPGLSRDQIIAGFNQIAGDLSGQRPSAAAIY